MADKLCQNRLKTTIVANPTTTQFGTRGVRGRSTRFFLKFVTKPIEIGFLIIKIDAYCLESIFRPIAVWFGQLDLIGLIGLKH